MYNFIIIIQYFTAVYFLILTTAIIVLTTLWKNVLLWFESKTLIITFIIISLVLIIIKWDVESNRAGIKANSTSLTAFGFPRNRCILLLHPEFYWGFSIVVGRWVRRGFHESCRGLDSIVIIIIFPSIIICLFPSF